MAGKTMKVSEEGDEEAEVGKLQQAAAELYTLTNRLRSQNSVGILHPIDSAVGDLSTCDKLSACQSACTGWKPMPRIVPKCLAP